MRLRPGNLDRVGKSVLLHCIQLARGRLGTAWFIPDLIAGGILIGIRVRPPLIEGILADEQLEQIAAVLILGHFHLLPTDHDFVAVAHRGYTLWGSIHVAANGLKLEFLVTNRFHISNHVYNGRCDPAEIVKLVKFHI